MGRNGRDEGLGTKVDLCVRCPLVPTAVRFAALGVHCGAGCCTWFRLNCGNIISAGVSQVTMEALRRVFGCVAFCASCVSAAAAGMARHHRHGGRASCVTKQDCLTKRQTDLAHPTAGAALLLLAETLPQSGPLLVRKRIASRRQADLARLTADAELLPLLCQMLDEDFYAESRAAAAAAAADLAAIAAAAGPGPSPELCSTPLDPDTQMAEAPAAARPLGDGEDDGGATAASMVADTNLAAAVVDALAPALLKRLDDSADAVRVAAAGALAQLAACLAAAKHGGEGVRDSHGAAAAAALLVRRRIFSMRA